MFLSVHKVNNLSKNIIFIRKGVIHLFNYNYNKKIDYQ